MGCRNGGPPGTLPQLFQIPPHPSLIPVPTSVSVLENCLTLSTATILDSKSDNILIIQFRPNVTWPKGLVVGRVIPSIPHPMKWLWEEFGHLDYAPVPPMTQKGLDKPIDVPHGALITLYLRQ